MIRFSSRLVRFVSIAICIVILMMTNIAPALAAAPTWLEIDGGGLKRPIVVQWEDVPEIRALDWTWAVSCYPPCDPESLLDPNSPRRVEAALAVSGTPYVFRLKLGPPAAAREWVIAEWRYHQSMGTSPALMELVHHEGIPRWDGTWFKAKPANSEFLLRLLLGNGCTRGGGIPCVPIGQEHSFVRLKWAIIR